MCRQASRSAWIKAARPVTMATFDPRGTWVAAVIASTIFRLQQFVSRTRALAIPSRGISRSPQRVRAWATLVLKDSSLCWSVVPL